MLGGITPLSGAEKNAPDEQSIPVEEVKQSQPAASSDEPQSHNVMADVIARHEQIANRIKR